MPDVGHNGPPVASDRLRALVDRLETLDDERLAVVEAMKTIYSEAKGDGFDTKAIRKLIALRRQDRGKLLSDKAVLELYASAIGCLDLV